MKILILLFLLCLLLTQYKVKDGFNQHDSLNNASTYINDEITQTTDPEKRQKLLNANNYITFIKTQIK
jgi:hypothetical protein